MRKYEVKDLPAFVNQIENLSLISSLVYRGQSVSGNLLPTIARDDPTKNTIKMEKNLLEELALAGASLITLPYTSKPSHPRVLELMVLAQHFGLKTRLLDWTGNALAALWFACADPKPGDVYVYALESHGLLIPNVYGQDPFKQAKTRLFQPRFNNARIIAQRGWFTIHRYSDRAGKFVPLESNPEIKERLNELRIPEKSREQMLESLERHGIARSTLFPDLEGLCKHLNWKFGLSNGV